MFAIAEKDTFNVKSVQAVLDEAASKARAATASFLANHVNGFSACGFAWVNVSGVRSNSKLGKILALAGFRKDYTGALCLWNPSGHSTQCITAKEIGADAYAAVLRDQLGLERCYAGSRMD